MFRRRAFPKADDDLETTDVKRVTLLNDGNVVGYGMVFGDMFTQLDLLEPWQGVSRINAPSLAEALKQGHNLYPALEWEWTCVDVG